MNYADTKSVPAVLAATDAGGFTAIASTGSVDRDGEVVAPGCFAHPTLPDSVPVHLDHNLTVAGLVGRGRPYYVGDQLWIDGRFSSTPEAQSARRKAAEGVLDSMSIVFRGLEWRTVDGVRTCVRGDLLAADLVTVPSQPQARVLSVRGGLGGPSVVPQARRVLADALLELARVELKHARSVLAADPRSGSARDRVERALREPSPLSARRHVEERLRGLDR